jgi:PAS domain S-box-containing protein
MLRIVGMVADVTKRKRAEEALRESEERLHLAIQAGGMYAYEWDPLTDRVTRSAECIDILGKDEPLQITRRELSARVHPDDREQFAANPSQPTPEHSNSQMTYRVLRHDGSVIWLEKSARAFFDDQGRMLRMIGVVADITARKHAEQALAQSQERFSKAFRQSPMLLTLSNARDHRYIEVNETFERITGWRRDEVIGRTAFDLGLWADPAQRVDVIKRLLAEGSLRNLEARFCMRDGSIRIGQVSAEMIELDGQPCALGVIADITERKRAEEALRESESRFRLVANTAPVLIWMSDTNKLCTYFNKPWLDFTGRSIESELGNGWAEGVHPEDFKACLETYTKAFDRREKFSMEYRLRRYDGEYRWVLDIGTPRFNQDDSFAGFIGSCVDFTDRKVAQQALRESEDKLRLLLDSTAEAIYGIDLEGRCTFCNTACLRALGYQRVEDLLGRNMHDLIHHSRTDGTKLPAETGRIMRALQTGQGVHVDDEVLWDAKGRSFSAEYWSYPQRKGREVVGAVVTFLDITERKRTEVALANLSRRLIETQEQERTRIARELHDDIGQRLALLTVELGQLPQDSPELPAQVGSHIDELRKQSSEIAADVQSLSHELHSSKLEYLGIATAMRGFCKEFSAQQNVEIVFAHDAISRTVPPDISLCLFRVLQEALHNAVKYSGVRHFDAQLRASSDAIDLTVRDSGPGFDVEEAMKTSGLGLVSMAERIKLVGGQLSIESHPGSGTTIHACVPLREPARAAP